MPFRDRASAGRSLAARLKNTFESESVIVLALPRGGVPIAVEIARTLRAPLEVLVVRKLGAPNNPEFAIGAIAEGNEQWVNYASAYALGASASQLKEILAAEQGELLRRLQIYRDGRALPSLVGKTAILVDDGLATGASARVAAQRVRALGAKKVVFASPICLTRAARSLRSEVDAVICLEERTASSVSASYETFPQLSDEEVVSLIEDSRLRRSA